MYQDPQWIPESEDRLKPIYAMFFLYIHTCDKI